MRRAATHRVPGQALKSADGPASRSAPLDDELASDELGAAPCSLPSSAYVADRGGAPGEYASPASIGLRPGVLPPSTRAQSMDVLVLAPSNLAGLQAVIDAFQRFRTAPFRR